MDYTTLIPEIKTGAEETPPLSPSLYETLQQLEDTRAARGKRYDLATLLILLVLAKCAGMKSLLGASDWIADQQEWLCTRLHLSWKRMPCANTYRYALASLESQELNTHIAAWLVRYQAQRRCGEEPSRLLTQKSTQGQHLAIDGKALKGTGKQSYGGEEPQKHLLHVYEVQSGIVLEQCPIALEHNEVSTLKPLLTPTLCKGRILTADAAQNYHDYGRLVKRAGGEMIMVVKENTPLIRADLELFFEDPEADRSTWKTFERVEKGHGRLERRHIITSPDLNEYLYSDWGEVGQVFRLQRERNSKEKQSIEVVYGWTSLDGSTCSPERLLQLLRDHWAVEIV